VAIVASVLTTDRRFEAPLADPQLERCLHDLRAGHPITLTLAVHTLDQLVCKTKRYHP
jgi:hypothetical protein